MAACAMGELHVTSRYTGHLWSLERVNWSATPGLTGWLGLARTYGLQRAIARVLRPQRAFDWNPEDVGDPRTKNGTTSEERVGQETDTSNPPLLYEEGRR